MELVSILDLISISAVCAAVIAIILLFIPRILSNITAVQFSEMPRVYLSIFLIIMTTCWLVGRQNINEFRRLSKYLYRLKRSEGCCTQAMLYPTVVVETVAEHLVTMAPSTHTDLGIMDLAAMSRLPALQIEPSLFYHTGLVTSLAQEQKHPE